MKTVPSKVWRFFRVALCSCLWLLFGGTGRKFEKVVLVYRTGGIKLVWQFAVIKFGSECHNYNPAENELTPEQSRMLIEQFDSKPRISIVVPVYRIAPQWLEKCIASVYSQHYSNWQLILVDDHSEQSSLADLIRKWEAKDNRIIAIFLSKNLGISGATNAGIDGACGEYIGFLDHDDELSADALTWVVHAINKNPQAKWFYSDEDKISTDGKYHGPHFKPDFSRELLLSQMFTCHFSIYATSVIRHVNGLREGFEGSQDHEMAIRLSEIVPQNCVIHIPRVLYHWRQIPGSTALCITEKPKAPLAGIKAVKEALVRRGLSGEVTSNSICPTIYELRLKPSIYPRVSIIIPTRNSFELVERAIFSIRSQTKYPDYEIIVIDNNSDDPQLLDWLANEQQNQTLTIVKYSDLFNHSAMHNAVIPTLTSEYVVLMNNDVEITTPDWLDQFVATAQSDDRIAAVGSLLLYPNGTVQHGGMILGIGGLIGHSHKYLPAKLPGYFGRLVSMQEMSGVTAALCLIRKSAFLEVGGFDAQRYPTICNDADLCLRFRSRGYRCIYNPSVRAIHHESRTRPISKVELNGRSNFLSQYRTLLDYDPFYNPNMTLQNEQFNGFRPYPIEKQLPELVQQLQLVSK